MNHPTAEFGLTQGDFATRDPAVVNIAAYKFVTLEDLPDRRKRLQKICAERNLKGTILLTPEGINLFVAGSRSGIDNLLDELRSDALLSDLTVKESFSDEQPFERMLVKIKSEIIAFGIEGVDPRRKTSPKLPPQQLKAWLDAGKEVLLLDTRNDYEVRVGTFENAVPIGVDHFRDFPEAVARLPEETKDQPIVMFCTGGIRCEKAGPFMEQAGFREIYQLEGGILKYFEECGGEHYDGDCFVFDKRVALNPELKETEATQCYACLAPLTVEDQASEKYDPPHCCPHCYQSPEERRQSRLAQRRQALIDVTHPLPGSVPYDNARPLNVPQQFDGVTLLEFLNGYHPHLGEDYWKQVCAEGRIHQSGQPVWADRIVRAGNQFAHLQPATVEPSVNVQIEFIEEDDAIVVVHKPAPLPIHPSGRFHRNTLEWILNEVYHPHRLRPAHRLDANTTGIVVFSKTRSISAVLQPQFETGEVEKIYVARVQGVINWEHMTCDAPISRETAECGGRVVDLDGGLPAVTRFERLKAFEDGTTLLKVVPQTGRTNQIRVHLWHLGIPIVGDPLYLKNQQFGSRQTLEIGEPMCLHAQQLSFLHPETRERVTFTAPDPEWTSRETNPC